MARKQQVQTRIAADTQEQLDKYQEEYDLSQADALRRLVRSGLEVEGHPVATADGGALRDDLAGIRSDVRRATTGTFAAVAYLAVAVLAPSTLPWSIGLSVAGIVLAVILWYAGMLDVDALRGESDD